MKNIASLTNITALTVMSVENGGYVVYQAPASQYELNRLLYACTTFDEVIAFMRLIDEADGIEKADA